ncbi:hypothetical protein ACFW5G_01295 [Streptomyces griseoaurantiacus]|uniref:hypothetical protein n=1 Tax=Streptomyces griseoaurantiacus TaxID=68213 RepID=UPI00368F3923
MPWVRCPTCPGSDLKWFRDLEEKEYGPAELAVLALFPEETPFRPAAYQRCTRGTCRRVQRKDRWKTGASLPEGL